ncbi:MAG: hypothetical protein AAFR27_00620 [Pseudomonadota bacterium]
MRLLLKRDQKRGGFSLIPLRVGTGNVFALRAFIELTDEEEELLTRFGLKNAILVESDTLEDLKQAFRPALFLGFLAFAIAFFMIGFWSAFPFGIITTLIMTMVYFQSLREQLKVSDLMGTGRVFRCYSVVLLVQKEAYLKMICQYLRQILEAAKTWDDREVVDIEPLEPAAAKLAILKQL